MKPTPPGYWMQETSGQLALPMRRYLYGWPLSGEDVAAIRAYLRQWICSGVWDENPDLDEFGRRQLAALREAVALLIDRPSIEFWIAVAVDFGLDPL